MQTIILFIACTIFVSFHQTLFLKVRRKMKNIIEISDLSAPELIPYTDTSEKLLMDKHGLFIAESPNVIRTALDAGYEPVSLLADRGFVTGQGADIAERFDGIPIYTAAKDVLTQLTGYKLTKGMLSAMRRKPLPSADDVLSGTGRIAVLEDITNQTNIGAIFRSAAALGFDAVLLTKGCSDPLFRRTVRVSMGTVFQLPWTYTPLPSPEYITALRDAGFTTAAMALHDESVTIDDERLRSADRLALIFGTEGTGLKPETIKKCDLTVKIPMRRGVDSLNVAAASAVAFYMLGR